MSKVFNVSITEINGCCIQVRANDEEAAEEKIKEMLDDGMIEFFETTFKIEVLGA